MNSRGCNSAPGFTAGHETVGFTEMQDLPTDSGTTTEGALKSEMVCGRS
jgi:hypothetical protein